MFRWLLEIRTSTLNWIFVYSKLHFVHLPLEMATKEIPQCSSLLESFQGQTYESVCEAPCRRGCPQSSWCRDSWSGEAAAWGTCSTPPSPSSSGGSRRREAEPALKNIIGFTTMKPCSRKMKNLFVSLYNAGANFPYLDIILTHWEFPSVGEIHQKSQSQRVNIVDCDLRQVLFCHVIYVDRFNFIRYLKIYWQKAAI